MPGERVGQGGPGAGRGARPERAVPGPGQESAWDYPRPPRVEPVPERVRVIMDGEVLADTSRAQRALETASPPVYYIPREDVRMDRLERSSQASVGEWKGQAAYFSYRGPGRRGPGRRAEDVAWSYEHPNPGLEPITGHLAFYAGRVDEAWVGDERATPRPGRFYGGWITSRVVGLFKGEPGTFGW